MLKKINRLTGKDINFLIKKRNMIKGDFFSFVFFGQYQDKKYNQFSIQIPVKINKHSVYRNFMKRTIYNYINNSGYIKNPFNSKYYKIFVITNKNSIDSFKKTIESKNKKVIKDQTNKAFEASFKTLIHRLGKK